MASDLLDASQDAVEACRGVSQADIEKAFSYQKIAFDNGDLALQRWFVRSPALDLSNFVSQLDEWKAYRERATRFREKALANLEKADLDYLVWVHTPAGRFAPSGIARTRDDTLFLALVEAADKNGVAVSPSARSAYAQIKSQLSAPEQQRYERLRSTLVRTWKSPGQVTSRTPPRGYRVDVDPGLCDAAGH